LAEHNAAIVFVSVTELDAALARSWNRGFTACAPALCHRNLEPARVPVGVLVAPLIPALTDHEMPVILMVRRRPVPATRVTFRCGCHSGGPSF